MWILYGCLILWFGLFFGWLGGLLVLDLWIYLGSCRAARVVSSPIKNAFSLICLPHFPYLEILH